MGALLKKDFLTSRYIYSVITLLVIAVLVVLVKVNPVAAFMTATIGSVMVPIIVNKFTATEEMRKNYDVVMNSFPVKRKDVVISKYMYYLIMHFLTAVLLQGIVVINNLSDSSFLVTAFLVQGAAFIYYILFIGIPNYVYYRFDYDVATKYSAIIIIVVANLPLMISGLMDRVNPNLKITIIKSIEAGGRDAWILAGLVFLIGFIVYFIMAAASARSYARRDL